MAIPKLTEATIRRNANPASFERGEEYYRAGAVLFLTLRGAMLQAEVEGSTPDPYRVTLRFDEGGFTAVHCTCAYDHGGWCKHTVAVMLVCLREPETIEERPSLEVLLQSLDPTQTQQLIQALVNEKPDLIEAIDYHITQMAASPLQHAPAPGSNRRTSIDPSPFKRRVRQILREAVRYFEEGWDDDPITDSLIELVQEADEFSTRDDGNNAIAILDAITQACCDEWDEVNDYGADLEGLGNSLDESWTEAILTAELTTDEQVEIQMSLAHWQEEMDIDFSMSLEALHQGWNYFPLQRVLQGSKPNSGVWEDDRPTYADHLTLIRLHILERREQYQAYLNLADTEGQVQPYLTMLARLGQIEEAVKLATVKMTCMEEAFALAKTLREQEALPQALGIAQLGLRLAGNCQFELATWTSDLAEGLGDRTTALDTRLLAFTATPSFGDYQKIQELAADKWTAIQADLLKQLQQRQTWISHQAKVDIYLDAGWLDEAIATVTNLDYYYADLVHRVMQATISHNPAWVIQNARRRAEAIMDQKRADAYHHAIDWLKKVRAAYLTSGQREEWDTYRATLMAVHARKYKLIGLLRQADLD